MKCPYCGAELVEGSEFCVSCGAKFTNGGGNVEGNTPPISNYTPEPPKSGNKLNFIVVPLLLIIIIVLLLWIFVFGGSGNSNSNNSNTNNSGGSAVEQAKDYLSIYMLNNAYQEARTYINMGDAYRLYSTDTLLLIPAGQSGYGCLEESGVDGSKVKYAYIGITFSGDGYQYYILAVDNSGKGFNMLPASDLKSATPGKIEAIDVLTKYYQEKGNAYHILSEEEGNMNSLFKANSNIKQVVIVPQADCSYKLGY